MRTSTSTSAAAQCIAILLAASIASTVGCAPQQEKSPPATGGQKMGEIEKMAWDITVLPDGTFVVADFEKVARKQLARVAQSPETFAQVLTIALGTDYDRRKAEDIRGKILAADYSWTPLVRLVNPEALNDAGGAYDPVEHAVYLNERVKGTPIMALIYLEEVGHHLDSILRLTDAVGDEGSIFRHLVVGTKLDDAGLEMLRRKNDHGTIAVDGRQIEVEFFGLGSIVHAIGAVGGAIVAGFSAAATGIWDGAKWVWSSTATAGQAVVQAAGTTWDGAKILSGWIKEGLVWSADKTFESLKRDFFAAYDLLEYSAESLADAGMDLYEGTKTYGRGIVELAKGNLKDGVTLMLVGIAQLTVEAPLNFLTSAAIEAISVIQTVCFLQPLPRWLTDDEKADLASVHGEYRSWFDLIQVKDGFSGLFSVVPEPFTNHLTIFMKKWGIDHPALYRSTLIHESVHVWQFIHGGGDYRLSSILYAGLKGQAQYNWEADAGRPWSNLLAEEQAALIEAGFRGRFFDSPPVLPFLSATTGKDYTNYLRAAAKELANGSGVAQTVRF
jgi:hypothetical protein